MFGTLKTLAAACIAALSPMVFADQPVHCLKSQVAGYWTFEVSREAIVPDLKNAESVCTHELPNKLQIANSDIEFTLPGHTSELYVLLEADFTARVLESAQGNPTGETGTWTMIYDQAIIVELPQKHKARYMANLRYNLKKDIQESQYDGLKCGSYEAFDSVCDETMVGIKFNKDRMLQCWVGYQTQPLSNKKGKKTDLAASWVLAQTGSTKIDASDIDIATELAQAATHERLGNYKEIPVEERVAYAQTINEADLTWEADAYLDGHDGSGTILAQTASHSTMGHKKFNDGSHEFKKALGEAQKFLQVPLEDISMDDMPTHWDWQNVHGYDFTGKRMDQGRCGSCYLIATNTMMESRIKVWFGKDIGLSVQHRLDCSFVNEGCHGGWGFFDGMFLEQYGAVSDTCAKYEASMSPQGCGRWADCPIIANVEDVYYVGKRHYGGMSEQDMIKEVRARGPILVDFNAGREFQTYKKGILSEDKPVSKTFANDHSHQLAQIYSDTYCAKPHGRNSPHCNTSDKTQEQQGLQWAKLTHSTLIVGYGVENHASHGELRYWIVRNSYGPHWGEHGNLRLRRGRNDFGCEAENIALIPNLKNQED